MAANLLISAFDHELYRFLGLRLGPNFLNVYADPTTLVSLARSGRLTTLMAQGPLATGVNFLQMRGNYTVSGTAGDQRFSFSAPGSAETFRGEPAKAK